MSTPHMRWIVSASWLVLVFLVFVTLGASSTRSWLYFAVVAFGPPIALIRLWPQNPPQTAAQMMHDRRDVV